MPRSRPGGSRVGTPGQAYGNRTDLNQGHSLPVKVAPHQTYGAVTAQTQAQRAIPMAAPPLSLPAGPANLPSPGAPGPSLPGAPAVTPGAFGDIHRRTERPTEPVTAGSPLGAGPGPEAIPRGPSNPVNTNLSQMLSEIAQSSGSTAVQQLAQRAQAAGQ